MPRQHVHVFELDAMMDGMLRNTLGDFFKHIKVVASVSLKNRCKVYLEGNVRGEKMYCCAETNIAQSSLAHYLGLGHGPENGC